MKCTYKFYVYDELKERVFDYCPVGLYRVLEDTEIVKVKEGKEDSNKSEVYTRNKFKLIRMCAPNEIEIREMVYDIMQYYDEYFALKDNDEKKLEVEIHINCHKYAKNKYGCCLGEKIEIWYFSILNDLFLHAKITAKDLLKDVVEKCWRYTTKEVFINQLRYVMAHELFRALHWNKIKSEPLSVMLAEYFALSYINDFCNATERNQYSLVLRGRFTEKNKENGEIVGLKKDIECFVRSNNENCLQEGDYYGGTVLLAYGLKEKKLGKDNPYYARIFDAKQVNDYQNILRELIELRNN